MNKDMKLKKGDTITYDNEESIPLPYFKKGKMYKGMKRDKKYTLKELGLD